MSDNIYYVKFWRDKRNLSVHTVRSFDVLRRFDRYTSRETAPKRHRGIEGTAQGSPYPPRPYPARANPPHHYTLAPDFYIFWAFRYHGGTARPYLYFQLDHT